MLQGPALGFCRFLEFLELGFGRGGSDSESLDVGCEPELTL